MKNKEKTNFLNKKMVKLLILLVIIGLILCLIANKNNFIENIVRKIKGEEESTKEELFSYVMYDNQDENNIKVLVKVASEDGIEYVETPDNRKILSNGNKQVTLDYEVKKDENYTFKVKEVKKEPVTQNLIVDDEYIKNKILNFENLTEDTGTTTLQINRNMDFEDFVTYYQIGKNASWIQAENKQQVQITKDDFIDLYEKKLLNEDNTVTLGVKIVGKNSEQITIDSKDYKINMQPQPLEDIEGGIIQEIEKMDIKNDDHIELTIGDETYAMHTYVFEGNQEWNTNQTFGNTDDIGTASSYAKNMVVVKVNGNLTIGENVTVTTCNSAYGGPKGMLLYVTGNIINKGTISMTARGAYAVGQNVYLYRNNDSSVETVASNGANGANSVAGANGSAYASTNGLTGVNAVIRRTGGRR